MSTSEITEIPSSLQIKSAGVYISFHDAAAIAVQAEQGERWNEATEMWGWAAKAATHRDNQQWATARAEYNLRQVCLSGNLLWSEMRTLAALNGYSWGQF